MKYFIIIVSDKARETLKCIRPKLPKADNLVFWENSEGELHLHKVIQDHVQEADEGYTFPTTGDSGSGYFISSKVSIGGSKTEDRQTVIAVHSASTAPQNDQVLFMYNKVDSCLMIASKLSETVTSWLKSVDSDNSL